jgi:hypothetical protein
MVVYGTARVIFCLALTDKPIAMFPALDKPIAMLPVIFWVVAIPSVLTT